MPLESFYLKFRGTRTFLFTLCTFIIVWLLGHFLFKLDEGFGDLNLILSIEASIGVALLMKHNTKEKEKETRLEEERLKQLKYMIDLMEATKDLLNKQMPKDQQK